MSIASEITSIGENLKKDYQAIANLGADLTGVDKNIENIAELLDGVYDNYPKTSFQTGTEVTLENCNKGKIDFDEDNGKKIVGIGQSEQDTRQYIDVGTWEQGGVNGTTGEDDNGISMVRTGYVEVKPNVLYSISRSIYSSYMVFRFYDSNKNFLGNQLTTGMVTTSEAQNRMEQSDPNMTMTIINTNVAYMRMADASNDLSTIYTIYTDDTPSPSYPQEIKCVTGNIEEVVWGKNKFNNTSAPDFRGGTSYSSLDTGVRVINNDNNTSYCFQSYAVMDLSKYIGKTIRFKASFQANASNTRNYYIGLCDSSGGSRVSKASAQGVSGTPTSFVVPELTGNVKYLCVVLYSNNGGTALRDDYVDYTNVILTIDNEDMTYEPYYTPTTYPISLGNNKFYSIGDYKDELVTDRSTGKWYKYAQIGKITLNGTETNWDNWGTSVHTDTFSCRLLSVDNSIIGEQTDTGKALSNRYIVKAQNVLYRDDIEGMAYYNHNLYFRIPTSIATNLNDFKTWVSTHNIIVCYLFETPTLTEITDTTLINQLENWYNAKSINGTTIITGIGNLPMVIKVRALKGE